MKSYELTYIISSQLSSYQAEATAKEIESFIKNNEGVILRSEKISVQTLAYPIKKRSSGYFADLTFQVAEDKIKELKEKLEKSNQILRHLILVKKPARILKALRTRKPLTSSIFKAKREELFSGSVDDKSKSGQINLEEIERKLNEF